MSRTTTALKRLGVPAVAAITLFAGIPAFVATSANAAPGDVVTVTPEADTATAGTCNPFTVTARNASGAPATSTVDVNIEERTNAGSAAIETFDITFCTAPTGGVTPQAPSDVDSTESNVANDTDHAEFTVGPDGTFTFGVISQSPGIADIEVFIDDSSAGFNNDVRDNGEVGDTAVKTFVAGGPEVVRTVDATPETATNFVGEPHVIDVLLKDANGNTVAGVTPVADITSGPNNGINPDCGASNNDGVAECVYNGAAAGTDTIVVFVNQVDADNNSATSDTAGLDAGEPSDTVTKTYETGPTGLVVDLTCGDANTSRTTAENCINPLSENTEVFTATVTAPDGTDAGTARDVAPNVSIAFTVTPDNDTTNGAETVSPTVVSTDANGVATTTLTDTETNEGETVTVTATVRGQDAAQTGTSDSATKTFRTADDSEARFINITSGDNTTTTSGQFREITALVTNVNGEVVPGVEVTFTEVGPGSFRNGASSVTTVTDANGIARVDVTSSAGETGAQTITARITEPNTQCTQAAGAGNGATTGTAAGDCDDTTTNTFAAGTTSPPASPPAGNGPPGVPCTNATTVTLERTTITATGSTGVTVRTTPNSIVDLFAYTRPSTTYRVVRSAEVGADGVAEFRIVPPANTRLYAQQRGCDASPSIVLNVRTALSLNVTRTGVRAYRFFGDSLPARPGGLIISLYRVTNDGRQVLTSQTRANATNGEWVINRVFTGTGRFGFVVRTGQDLQNAPGASNVRSLLIF